MFRCLLAIFCCASLYGQQPEKHALIITIGDYPESSQWMDLHAANDRTLIQEALERQGFDSSKMLFLEDEAATKAAIQAAFQDQLFNQVNSGDLVVIHFSGHGQQVIDQNQDEQDGYDEAWVPYDSPQTYEAGVYEGEKLIRDDELGAWLNQIQQKLGPAGQILLTVDACHSGTSTRGFAIARGTDQKMAPQNHKPKRNKENRQIQGDLEGEDNLAPVTAIFASAAEELNYEYIDQEGFACGSLSFALSKAFTEMPAGATYKGFFDRVKKEMTAIAPRQTPQIEGDLNRGVFNGQIRAFPNHFTILRSLDKQTLILDAGTLANIFPGTTFKIYPIDTYDPANTTPIAIGTVANSLPLISEIKLENPLSKRDAIGAWAFVDQQNFGPIQVNLNCLLPEGPLRNQLLTALKAYKGINVQAEQPDLILEQSANGRLHLLTKDAQILTDLPANSATPNILAEQLTKRILEFTQATFLRGLEMENPFLNLEMQLIPVETMMENGQPKVVRQLEIEERMGADGIIRFKEEESFIIQVKNIGSQAAYYTVVDIWADHQLVALIPNPDCSLKRSDYFIKPGETHVLDNCIIDLYPPYGNEMLKLIATQEPLDIERIIDTRGGTNEPGNPFEQLFQTTFSSGAKRGGTPSIPPSAAHIHTLVFQITPK